MSDSSKVTLLLLQVNDGDRSAVDQLYELVYDELRRLAQSQLNDERPGHTLQATALVHEVYLRLLGQNDIHWENRSHFFAISAKAIRRILVDHARKRGRQKRGGGAERVSLSNVADVVDGDQSTDVVALNEALELLAAHDAAGAKVVELRYFGGLKTKEIAAVTGVSTRTVERQWQYARAWLYRQLAESHPDG